MIVFRLSKSKYAHDLSGKGAEKAGGRWNSKGTPMLYTSASRALCVAEIAVHTPLGIIPFDYAVSTIKLPGKALFEVKDKYLSPDWRSFPHADSTQKIGDEFIADGKHLVLQVPSAIIQDEYNFLINPTHKAFQNIQLQDVTPFTFDERLFRG